MSDSDLLNSSKIISFLSVLKVAGSIGIVVGDRLRTGARKFKFVVNGPLQADHLFPKFDLFVFIFVISQTRFLFVVEGFQFSVSCAIVIQIKKLDPV